MPFAMRADFFRRPAFVVAEDAGASVGVQFPAGKRRGVAVHDLSRAAGQRQFVQYRVVGAEDAGGIHEFSQPEDAPVREQLFHVRRV